LNNNHTKFSSAPSKRVLPETGAAVWHSRAAAALFHRRNENFRESQSRAFREKQPQHNKEKPKQ
jgi:hypothetical protein